MIFEALITICSSLIKLLFSWVNLPAFPEQAKVAIDTYMGYIFDNLDFLSFFVNVSTLKIVAGVAITLYAFEHIYKVIVWVIHKLPLSID